MCQFRNYLDPLSGVLVTIFITTFSEITWRHPELSRWFHRLMIGFTKTWRTVWSSSSSSYSNIGLHFDSYSLWKFTCVYYRSTDKHKSFGWHSWAWPVVVDTTGRLYDDFSRLVFLDTNRDTSALTNEIPEESDQFRFLRPTCYVNIKGSVFHSFETPSSTFNSFPRFYSSVLCRSGTWRVFSLIVLSDFLTPHSFSVTFLPSVLHSFLFCCK